MYPEGLEWAGRVERWRRDGDVQSTFVHMKLVVMVFCSLRIQLPLITPAGCILEDINFLWYIFVWFVLRCSFGSKLGKLDKLGR